MRAPLNTGLLCALLIFFSPSCQWQSTQDTLDTKFITSFKLQLTIPGDTIYDGKAFDARLEARASSTSGILKSIKGNILWVLTGGGTLTTVSCPAMADGLQICRMIYNGNLTAGSSKVIKLQAIHTDSKESVSEGFTVLTQAFSVSVPSRITANTSFTATITATDATGATNTTYSGTVIPYLALLPGRPNVDEISNFVNGVATVQMQIHKPAWQMQLIVYEKGNSANTGTSNTFRVVQSDANYAALDLTAIPVSATTNRLSWTYLESTIVNNYRIYRKDTSGIFQLLFTETLTTKSFFLDTGLTTGTAYDYKVEAVNSGGLVISTDYASSTPKACTAIATAPTVLTTYTKSQSPYCITASMTFGAPIIFEPGTIVLLNTGVVLTPNSLFQAIGTPNNRITFASINNAQDTTAGINVSNPSPSVIDGSFNYVSGSGFRYVVFEYLGSAYWQKPMHYGNTMLRYSNGIAFERFGVSNLLNAVMDGMMYVRGGDGIQIFHSQTALVQNCIFFRNTSRYGALHVKNDDTGGNMDIRISGNYFALNTASTGGAAAGGAITADPQNGNLQNGNLQISDNSFFNNTAVAAGYNGGAVRLVLKGTPAYSVTNNTFASNAAVNGGGISFETTTATSVNLSYNYFTGNSATTNGGAVYVAAGAGAFTATYNQFSGNTATANGKNFFNNIAQNHNVQFGYWDASTDSTCTAPLRLALGIADSCGGGGSGTVNAANAVATQYALCVNDTTATNCVGSR